MMNLEWLETLRIAEALSATRGMRVSKAATRMGLDPQAAKACSVASEILFAETKEEFVEAARTIGHSCMTETPESYLYWHAASTADKLHPVRVATYRDARCLVRIDTREFVKCYGSNAGELHLALVWLGFRWNESALIDLEIPDKIRTGTERVFLRSVPKTSRVFEYTIYDADHFPHRVANAARVPAGACRVSSALQVVEHMDVHYSRPIYARRPYCDGRRKFL